MLTLWSKFLLIFAFKVFLAVRNYKVQCTYAKESAVISSAIYHTAKWVVRVPGLARLAFSDCVWRRGGGFFRYGTLSCVIIITDINIVTAATWISCGLAWPIIPLMHIEGIQSASQSVTVGPCDSFGFTLAFPVGARFWIAHDLSGYPVESCLYLHREKYHLGVLKYSLFIT